jgi:purine-nucleoside phosphorylase
MDDPQDLPAALANFGAKTAIVLGSGLNAFADSLEIEETIPYSAVSGLPVSKVPGHAGAFALARIDSAPLLVARGRVHLYEGWTAAEVTAGIRRLHSAGVERVILTNAAGTLNPAFPPGEWMMLSDHINLTGASPLTGGAHFIDLTAAYSPALRTLFREAAGEANVPLHDGIYASLPGPQYETPAEVRMLRTLGADAVGMSTVLETIQARAIGMEVAAFSCLTNWAAGIGSDVLNHDEVTDTGRAAASQLVAVLRAALPRLIA